MKKVLLKKKWQTYWEFLTMLPTALKTKNNYNLKENGKLDFNLMEVKKILEILNSSYEDIFFEKNVTQKSDNAFEEKEE